MALDSEARQKKTRTRSPAYPFIDLRAALEKAAMLWKAEGRHPAVMNVVMQHWGYKEESSTGYSCVAALKKFGLVDHEGMGDARQIRLSNLALAILLDEDPNSREREEALRTAALLPRIHAELWEKYGPDLPSDQSLKRFLVLERQFNEAAVDELLDEYKVTMSFAGLHRANGNGNANNGLGVNGTMPMSSMSHAAAGGQGGGRAGAAGFSAGAAADAYDSSRRAESPASAFKPSLRPASGPGGGWTANGAPGAFGAQPIHAAQHGTGGRLTRPPAELDDEDDEDDWGVPSPWPSSAHLSAHAPAPSSTAGGASSAGAPQSAFAGRSRAFEPAMRADHRPPTADHRAERAPEIPASLPPTAPLAAARAGESSGGAAVPVRDAAFWEEQRELLHVEARPRPSAAGPDAAAGSGLASAAAPIARKELPVPLDNDLVARVPYPMTEEDFLLLIETLQLWKKRLVRPRE